MMVRSFKIFRSTWRVLLAGLLLAACSPGIARLPLSPSQTAAPPFTSLPTVTIPAKTAAPAPGPLSSPVASLAPAASPTPTPVPATWEIYTDLQLHLSLRYPPNWKPVSPTSYSGADGYFQLFTQSYPASLNDDLLNRCVLAANADRPAAFGPNPLIGDAYWFNIDLFQGLSLNDCIVMPTAGAPKTANQALLYTRLPAPQSPDTLLILRTDPAHFTGILSTLRFTDVPPQPTLSTTYDAPACAQTPTSPPVSISHFADLTITEYAIAVASCDPFKQIDGFQVRLRALDEQLSAARGRSFSRQVAAANAALAPFGYRLVQPVVNGIRADLSFGDNQLLSGIASLGQVSVNTKGDDFVFWVVGEFNHSQPVEVRTSGLRPLTYPSAEGNGFNTAWVGPDLLSYQYGMPELSPVNRPTQVQIFRAGQAIASLAVPPEGPPGPPVVGFWSFQGHWLLEEAGVVFQDGLVINRHYGYDEMFDWHPVNGKSFFFYHQSGHYGLFYNGQPLQHRYNDVIHGLMCCEIGVYSTQSSSDGAWFFARRGDTWYLVSVLGGS